MTVFISGILAKKAKEYLPGNYLLQICMILYLECFSQKVLEATFWILTSF